MAKSSRNPNGLTASAAYAVYVPKQVRGEVWSKIMQSVTQKNKKSAHQDKSANGFLQGRGGTVLALIVLLAGGIAIYMGYQNMASNGADSANRRIFICAKTLKQYEINLTLSTPIPAPSPFTGQNTGYPAELCYWTADGQIKKDPTAVLLQNLAQPGYVGPTFCPDCGRLVVGHNPKPGDNPPPTREQWMARHAAWTNGQ
jgi:hypothetical protein